VLDELGVTAFRSKYVHFEERDGQTRFAAFAHMTGPLRGVFNGCATAGMQRPGQSNGPQPETRGPGPSASRRTRR
jgi:hypothetical protein